MGRKASGSSQGLTKYDLWALAIDRGFLILKIVTWFAGICATGYFWVVLPVYYSAGKQTGFYFVYKAIADFRIALIVSAGAAAVFGWLWRKERKLRKDDIQRLHKQIKTLESVVDPSRSSSGLTERGETPGGEP